jgi:ATP-dependent helicase/nuclease subunit A
LIDNLKQITNLQNIASNPDNSCWVFASAGSGKTKILTDRVIRMLLEGIKAEKILCITYTKVAAMEMQNRINEKLSNWTIIEEDQLINEIEKITSSKPTSKIINRARSLFAFNLDFETKLKIQTIHSFCQSLIKIFPFETEISPNFEILEENQEKLLLQIAQKKVFQNCQNSLLLNSIEKISEFINEDNLNDLFSELLNKKDKLIFFKENNISANEIINQIYYGFEVDRSCSEEEIFNNFLSKINFEEIEFLVKNLVSLGGKNDQKNAEKISKFLLNPNLYNFSIFQSAFLTQENQARKFSKKISENNQLNQILEKQVEAIKKFLSQIQCHQICKKSEYFILLSEAILEEYNKIKKSQNYVDYSDLIIKTNSLLNNSEFADWVKRRMDSFYNHILIDESQDTNFQQFQIIKAITEDFFSGETAIKEKRSLFIVGDEKQSIYSFQGAEIEMFDQIFNYFSEKLASINKQLIKIDLNNSFRSLPNILKIVDTVFSEEERKNAITKISNFNHHIAIREGDGVVEVWPIIDFKKSKKTSGKENNQPKDEEKSYQWQVNYSDNIDNFSTYDEKDFLAENIAIFIKNYVEEKRLINLSNKVIGYQDFMILLRKRAGGFDKILQSYFKKYQIPFCGNNKIKFSENIIIQDLLAFAKFALFDYDDLNLASVLKSPIFNISENQLKQLCEIKNKKQINLFEAIELARNDSQEFEKLYQSLVKIKAQDKQNSYQFFDKLIDQKIKKNYLLNYQQESTEIIESFLIKIANFYHNQNFSLLQLVNFIEKTDPEIAVIFDQKDAVLISTIHSAKGLQSKIVIMADCNFNFSRLPSNKENISWIKFDNYPFAVPVLSTSSDISENKKIFEHKKHNSKLAYEENLRLLYVAMTRAEDELYITGFNKLEENSWYDIVKKSLEKESQNESQHQLKKIEFGDYFNQKILPQSKEYAKFGSEFSDHEIISFGRKNYQFSLSATEKREENYLTISQAKSFPNNAEIIDENNSLAEDFLFEQNLNLVKKENFSQKKGKIIHKILEILIKSKIQDLAELKILSDDILNNSKNFDNSEKKEISQIIENFIKSEIFAEIIDNRNYSEVEFIAKINNKNSLKRIDLIVEKEDQIVIFDYKTDKKKSAEEDKKYHQQMLIYLDGVKKIYPDKSIKAAIIWLSDLKVEFIS